ncbi:MAG: PorT family protein [Bacteroidota bacterium]|nr:PorT family protein [Bacteroidota bacterium]
MKYFAVLFFALFALKAEGQSHLIGLRSGLNWAKITNEIVLNDHIKGFSGGITYEYLMPNNFSLGAELAYLRRGFSDKIILTDFSNKITYEYLPIHLYDFITLPLKTGFNTGGRVYGFANIGIVPSILLNTQFKMIGYSPYHTDFDAMSKEIFRNTPKFDLAGLAEIGGGYKLQGNFQLFASFTYQHSFRLQPKDRSFSFYRYLRYTGKIASVGIKYNLNK